MSVNERECEAAGIDPEAIKRLASRLSRCARDAEKLGVYVFGGAHSGSIRCADGSNDPLVLADLDGAWDGGDGGCSDSSGLMRGE